MTLIFSIAALWGDVPAWLAAIGTVGALFAALKLLREDMRDRKSQRATERQLVARRVSAWCYTSVEPPTLWVQNLAEEPIYDCVAYVGRMFADLDALPEPGNDYVEAVMGVVPPGAKLEHFVSRSDVSGAPFPDIPAVAVEFTDPRGIHWRRAANGGLREVPFRRPFD